jgi:Coenzyme PQQ synthesis protein D (PqqD)
MGASATVGPVIAELSVVEIDGCVSVFNPATKRAVILNETATMVWHLIDGSRDADEIVQELASRYGVEPTKIHADVAAAITRLRDEKLLQ